MNKDENFHKSEALKADGRTNSAKKLVQKQG